MSVTNLTIYKCDRCGRVDQNPLNWFRIAVLGTDVRVLSDPQWVNNLPSDFCSIECLLLLGVAPGREGVKG